MRASISRREPALATRADACRGPYEIIGDSDELGYVNTPGFGGAGGALTGVIHYQVFASDEELKLFAVSDLGKGATYPGPV